MQTKNLIQTIANVIKITSLKKGDVVKMIETKYSEPESYFAVVLDMLNDGENTFIELLRYKKSYDDVYAEIKLYKGSDDISLFPTDIDELKEYFSSAVNKIEENIKEDKEKLANKISALAKAKEFISGELSKKLTAVEFSEVEQSKYVQLQEEKRARLEALENEN